MGILVTFQEPFELDNGLTVTTTYASFKMSSPKIHKHRLTSGEVEEDVYRVDGELAFWVNKTSADTGKQPIHRMPYGFDVPEIPTNNLYQFLYGKIAELETTWTIVNSI